MTTKYLLVLGFSEKAVGMFIGNCFVVCINLNKKYSNNVPVI